MNRFLFAIYTWRETTTLYVTLNFFSHSGVSSQGEVINLTGALGIPLKGPLNSIMSLEGTGKIGFLFLLSLSLLRTYILQMPRGNQKGHKPPDSYHKRYPNSTLHEIKTGIQISISTV